MSDKTKEKLTKKNAIGDFTKFNDETLEAIDDAMNDRNLHTYKDFNEFKKELFEDKEQC